MRRCARATRHEVLQPRGLAPGLLIEHIHPGGPAEAAGLRRGDLLIGGGDRDIRSISCLAEAIAASPGDVTLRVRRGDQTTEITIRAGSWLPGPGGKHRRYRAGSLIGRADVE